MDVVHVTHGVTDPLDANVPIVESDALTAHARGGTVFASSLIGEREIE